MIPPTKQKRSHPTLNIHSEHLDLELIKYLYQVYLHKKVLRNELSVKMKRQSNQTTTTTTSKNPSQDSGECTPKRTASTLLRVTYFDDFDLFRTTTTTGQGQQGSENKPLLSAVKSDPKGVVSKINYNKSSSANDLDAYPLPQRPPNKTHSLDKPYHRNNEQPPSSTESQAAVILPGAYGVSTVCSHVSNNSSSTELFESTRSYVEAIDEEGFKTPRSQDSSTASYGLVSCTSKVEDEDTVVPEAAVAGEQNNVHCDTEYCAVLNSNRVLGESSADVSSSSVISSATLCSSSYEQPLSDYQTAVSAGLTSDCTISVGTGRDHK